MKGKTGLASVWLVPAGLALLALLFLWLGKDATALLRFERVGLARGELWRLLSAHLVHLGVSHTLLNLAGLVLVWGLVGNAFSQRGWWLVVLFTSLFCSVALWLWQAELRWYVGLSGVLHGLLLAGALRQGLQGDYGALVVVALVCAKLAWEQWTGPLPGSEQAAGGKVVVDAHLYGAIAGAIAAAISRWHEKEERQEGSG